MTPDELLLLFSHLRMAPVNGGRAIHKPLLVLFWLGRLDRGEPRLARFVEVEARFKQLLTEFGSSNSPQTRHLPFWHLCNDAAPMATSNSPTFGQSNSSRQDGRIISRLMCRGPCALRPP